MNPILLQKQLKQNATDFNDFYKDLKSWGDEMKRKEESLKLNNDLPNSDKKNDTLPKKKKKVEFKQAETLKVKPGATDYAAWDNFDADAECEKIDYNENEDSDLTDECDDTVRDQAYLEKEKGNNYVKDKKWDEAIDCYNKAINYYSYDPIFYANRALCYLKKENFIKAELDCTMSLKLDATYVKALQRRAASREALGKFSEAEADLLKVLELEPRNKESKTNLDILRTKLQNQKPLERTHPVSKFTASRNKKDTKNSCVINKETTIITKSVCENGVKDDIIPVKAIMKPIHLQSRKPLKRIEIHETVGCTEKQEATQSLPKPNISSMTFKTDDLKVIEKQPSMHEVIKENKNQTNMKMNETQTQLKAPVMSVQNQTNIKMNETETQLKAPVNSVQNQTNMRMNETQIQLKAPVNSVQFYSQWRHLKTKDKKYAYLKLIEPESLPMIFQESLESNVFSEIIEILATCFIQDNHGVFNFLKFFPEMRRFSTLILFITATDKNYLRKLFDYAQQHEGHTEEEIDQLFKKYEM